MKSIYPLKTKIPRLLIFATILFCVLFFANSQTTAFDESFTLDWTLVGTFIKSYIFIVLLYACFMLYDSFTPIPLEQKEELRTSFQSVLHILQKCFLVAITFQVVFNLYDIWYEFGLYPIELEFWESVWTLIRFCIGLIGTWMLELWFWIGKQLRISFLLNNPCIGSICLEEYPWASVLLTLMLGYVGKQLWKITLIRGTIRFFGYIIYSIIRTVGKFILKKLSQKASQHISSALLISIAKQVFSTVKNIYHVPIKEVETEVQTQQIIE